ncbi:MAG: RNA-binding S4 domain-containing protein [Oscillospiraceae bacterium]|jgi:ribosomal 50S subunit-recycling heat shock protein|nr:RNA-binding S4 domain-containing protein [Oscillospiraceae bacterium]
MRLDKYLKVSRLIKRRTVAAEAAGGGRVKLNGREAKPGAAVKPGDVIEVRFGERRISVEVLSVDEKTRPDSGAAMYREISHREIPG